MTIKKGILAFVLCFAIGLLQANMAYGIDWEQWRIQDNSLGSFPVGVKRPAPDPRKAEAFKLNEKGNQAYKARNWKEAIDYYKKALMKSPNDKVIRQNLTIAQNALAEEKERLVIWQRLEKENKRKRERENNELLCMLGDVDSQSIESVRASGYLGFDEAKTEQVSDTKYEFLGVVDLPEPVGFEEIWREKEKQLIAQRKQNPYKPDKYKSLKSSFVPPLPDAEKKSANNYSAQLQAYFKELELEEYYVEYGKCRDKIKAQCGEWFAKEIDKEFWRRVKKRGPKLGLGRNAISRAKKFYEIYSKVIEKCLTNATNKMDKAVRR